MTGAAPAEGLLQRAGHLADRFAKLALLRMNECGPMDGNRFPGTAEKC